MAKAEAPNSPKTKMIMEINRVLLLVFPPPNAQTLGAWLTAFFRLPSGSRSKFAWTAQVYGFEWFGVSGQSKYHWRPPLVFQGLAPMDQLSKSRTKNNLQAKYRTPQMLLAAHHWFSEDKLHNLSRSCSRQTTTSTEKMVSSICGWERNLTRVNWMDWSITDELKLLAKLLSFVISLGIWVNPLAL